MRKLLILLLLALMLGSGCITDEPIRIGVNSWPPCEIWYIAAAKGFFKGVNVRIIRFSNWSDNINSLYKGNIDITHSTYFNTLYYKNRGEDGKIFLVSDYALGADGLAVKRNIKSIAALKGKKVAVEVNTDEHFLLYETLKNKGLNIKDLELISTTSEEAMQKFINNEVDACYTYEPFLSKAAKEGEGVILSTTNDLKGYMIDVLVGRTRVISKRKADFQKIINAWYKTQAFIKSNPKEVMKLMAQNEDMSPDDFKAFYDSFIFPSYKENIALLGSKDFRAKLNEMADFLMATEVMKSKIDVDEVYLKIIK